MEKFMPLGSLHPLSFHSHKLEPLLSALPSPPLRQSLLPVSLSLSLLLPSGLPEFYFPTPPLPQLHLCSSAVLNSGVLQIFTSSLSKVELTTSNPLSNLLLPLCSPRGSLSAPALPQTRGCLISIGTAT